MYVDLQNIPACAIFLIKNETVTKHRQLFERGQPSFHEFSRCKRGLKLAKTIQSRAEHVFFSLVPVIMDEVKRVKIVMTDTAYDFYMRKGTDKDQCFYLFLGE